MRRALGLLLVVSACGGGGDGAPDGTPFDAAEPDAVPPDAAIPDRLYVSVGGTELQAYDLPLSSTSTPALTFPLTNAAGLCTGGGRLYAVSFGNPGHVDVFAEPLTSSSTPLFTLTTTFSSNDCELDAAGNLYVAANESTTQGIDVFPAPITSASTVSKNITDAALYAPYGLAIDTTGNVFAATAGAIEEFGPLASNNPRVATFGSLPSNYGLAFDSDGNLYAANTNIDVYNPLQFHDGTTAPSTTFTMPNPMYWLIFDSADNLYVSGQDSATNKMIMVFAPPYTGSPTATVALPAYGEGFVFAP